MPFGLKDTYAYTSSRTTKINYPVSVHVCPICERETPGVAPMHIPSSANPCVVEFGCPRCYRLYKLHDPQSTDELKNVVTNTKRGRPKLPEGSIPVKRPSKPKKVAAPVVQEVSVRPDIYKDIAKHLRSLASLFEALCDDRSISDELRDLAPDKDPFLVEEDDFEDGMTDEQKLRMQQAVAMAAARSTMVPEESWNE